MNNMEVPAIPPGMGAAPSIIAVEPNIYMHHTIEKIFPSLVDYLTTVGITDSEVISKFMRILITGDLSLNAEALLDSTLGLIVNVSYDALLHEADSKIRFFFNEPFMSQPVDLGKTAPLPKRSLIQKSCKRISHYAGISIELALLQRIFTILSKDEEELKRKLSGLQEIAIKFDRLRVQSLHSLTDSFKRGVIKCILDFIKEISPSIHSAKAVKELMCNSTCIEVTSPSIIHMMRKINENFATTCFTCNVSIPQFKKAVGDCVKLTNGYLLVHDMDYITKKAVTKQSLEQLVTDTVKYDLNQFDIVGILILGGKTFDFVAPHTKKRVVLTDTRRGIISFVADEYKSVIESGIMVSEGRLQSTLDKLASQKILKETSTSSSEMLTILRGEFDPNAKTSDCIGGNNGIKEMICDILETPQGPIAIYTAEEMFNILNKGNQYICKDKLRIVGQTVLGSTAAMHKSTKIQNILPDSIYWRNADKNLVQVKMSDMIPYLCSPQLYNDDLIKRYFDSDPLAKSIYDLNKLVDDQCIHGTTMYTNVFLKGSIMKQTAFPYLHRAKMMYHLNGSNFRDTNLLKYELNPFFDIIIGRKNGKNYQYKKAMETLSQKLKPKTIINNSTPSKTIKNLQPPSKTIKHDQKQ